MAKKSRQNITMVKDKYARFSLFDKYVCMCPNLLIYIAALLGKKS